MSYGNSPRVAPGDHVVETLGADSANETLGVWILPRCVGRREQFGDREARHPPSEGGTVGAVEIAHDLARRGVPGTRLDD